MWARKAHFPLEINRQERTAGASIAGMAPRLFLCFRLEQLGRARIKSECDTCRWTRITCPLFCLESTERGTCRVRAQAPIRESLTLTEWAVGSGPVERGSLSATHRESLPTAVTCRPGRARGTSWVWVALLVVLVPLIVLRDPIFFTAPRLWAEEGSTYIAEAFNEGGWRAFLNPHFGYFSLVANFAAWCTCQLIGLRGAAAFTTVLSAVLIAWTASLPLVYSSPSWPMRWQRLVISVSVLLISAGDQWVNTVNVQFFLAGGVFLLSRAHWDGAGRFKVALAVCYVAIASLTGVVSLFFLPLYLWGALKSSQSVTKWLAAVMVLGGLVQLASLFYCLRVGDAGERLSTAYLLHLPRAIGASLFQAWRLDVRMALWIRIVTLTPVLAALALLFWRRARELAFDMSWILFVAVLSCVLSLHMAGGPRYYYLGSIMMICVLVKLAGDGSRVALALVLVSVLARVPSFFLANNTYYSRSWPSYASEVARWQEDNSYRIRIFPRWPGKDWTMRIGDHKQL